MGPQASQDGHKVGPGLAHDIEENALRGAAGAAGGPPDPGATSGRSGGWGGSPDAS